MKKVLLMALLLLPLSLFAQKFGHFSSADVMQAMPEYKKATAELETLKKQYESDITTMQDELKRKGTAYDSAKDSLPENIRARREQELTDLDTRIRQTYSDNQTALQKAASDKYNAITTKILAAVKAIGDAGGYVYIMDVTAGIPYISATLSKDITPELKVKLGLK